jgi:hypothetical protein
MWQSDGGRCRAGRGTVRGCLRRQTLAALQLARRQHRVSQVHPAPQRPPACLRPLTVTAPSSSERLPRLWRLSEDAPSCKRAVAATPRPADLGLQPGAVQPHCARVLQVAALHGRHPCDSRCAPRSGPCPAHCRGCAHSPRLQPHSPATASPRTPTATIRHSAAAQPGPPLLASPRPTSATASRRGLMRAHDPHRLPRHVEA